MEFILDTARDEAVLVKLAHGQIKTYSPEHYRLVSEKEYQRLLAASLCNSQAGPAEDIPAAAPLQRAAAS